MNQLSAGVARADITDTTAGEPNDPLYAKALVLKDADTTVVLVTVDAVAIEEIGPIRNGYLQEVRTRLEAELNIQPESVIVAASHCHGAVCGDVADITVQSVKDAWKKVEPVRAGTGEGHEDTIMENRRMPLKSGKETDVRRAYSFPPDEEIRGVGPVDSEIGILRLDKLNGECLAVIYNFACHPIKGVPSGLNTADLVGFTSKVIEDNLDDGTMAFFLQGCGADINPIFYKDVNYPPDAEPLGNRLGLSTLRAVRKIRGERDQRLKLINVKADLPRAQLAPHIEALEAEQQRLLDSLQPNTLNLKAYLPLILKHKLSSDYPSYDSSRYLHEKQISKEDLARLDSENRSHLDTYTRNIYIMEELTRVRANLNLLRKNHAKNEAAEKDAIDIELVGLRVGEFVLVTFPGELSVQIGLNIKSQSPHQHTFIASMTNGYIYYCPTEEQLKNRGNAQEDTDCLVGEGWQKVFERDVGEILERL
jgi:hypothetical protein